MRPAPNHLRREVPAAYIVPLDILILLEEGASLHTITVGQCAKPDTRAVEVDDPLLEHFSLDEIIDMVKDLFLISHEREAIADRNPCFQPLLEAQVTARIYEIRESQGSSTIAVSCPIAI